MKKVIFVILLLAVAGLGLALPSNSSAIPPPKSPVIPPPTSIIPPPISPTFPPKSPKSPKSPISPNPPPTAGKALPAELSSPQALADGLKISSSCAAALVTLFTSPEFLKCIPVQAFLPLLPVITDPNFVKDLKADPAGTFKKDEKTFVQFSTLFCPAPKCSDKGVQGAIKLISDGCAEDLKDNPVIQMLFAAAVFYSPLHDTICFKSNEHKLFCWDESLETVFGLPKSPIKITGDPLLDSIAVSDCKSVCTDCNKSIINTFFNFVKAKGNDLALKLLAQMGIDQKAIDGLTLGVAVKCGISFEDGKIPNKF